MSLSNNERFVGKMGPLALLLEGDAEKVVLSQRILNGSSALVY
ncbi:hypothetical protein PNH38_13780 [Anoxybacillus rupiensis]|jgi:hypothetical protein|uniref:Uncharacterized protein n=1 Tax=Anoxybacteroides rupiense TaxID=311460 RepID=A0ABT5W6G4_9BACL|nr:hypothetical protein [Anoxybacillus rupiensis]